MNSILKKYVQEINFVIIIYNEQSLKQSNFKKGY
jgi:hypothetical protein